MNEGENSGASVTPETRDTSEKVFSVRNNNPTDETFSVVENSAAPNIQNGKKENSIADQMAAELALAEADEGGVLNVHEAPKFTSDNDEKIETITASSQDYADAFSIIGSNDKNKSVTVGSATAISAGKGKGKTGFFGRSRYNSEEAEEAKKRADEKRKAEEEAAARAAAEKAAADKAAADREAAIRAEEERKRMEKETAERERIAQATAKRIESRNAKQKTREAQPAAKQEAPQTPDFFAKAMSDRSDIILAQDQPRNSGKGKILAIALIAILLVGGGIAAAYFLKNKGGNSGGNNSVASFDIDSYGDLRDMMTVFYGNYELSSKAEPLYDEKVLDRVKHGFEQYDSYVSDFANLKFSSYGEDYRKKQAEIVVDLKSSRDIISGVIGDMEKINKAVYGDAAAKNELESSEDKLLKKLYEESNATVQYVEQKNNEYTAVCKVEDRSPDVTGYCSDLLRDIINAKYSKTLRSAASAYLRAKGDDKDFSINQNCITRANSLVLEIKNNEE